LEEILGVDPILAAVVIGIVEEVGVTTWAAGQGPD
jgi:hypothetical protein